MNDKSAQYYMKWIRLYDNGLCDGIHKMVQGWGDHVVQGYDTFLCNKAMRDTFLRGDNDGRETSDFIEIILAVQL